MKATKATEQKQHEIQRSNLLIEASYNIPSVDGYRIALIGMSNACINLLNNPDDETALTVAIKTKELQALFPAFRKAQGSIHKRIDQATDSIRELNSCICQINNKTNLKVEFEALKTSRKITDIKFTFCRKDLHPLDAINQENQKKQDKQISNTSNANNTSNIKAQLTALGFQHAKLPSLLKIPTEVLLRAITATNKAKTKGFKKTMEACFFFQVGIFKSERSDDDNNNANTNTTKIEPIQLVHLFKDNLSIEAMNALWNEFYVQLSEGQKNAYSASNREKNTTVKEALDHDFNNKYNRWIYEAKIKQG